MEKNKKNIINLVILVVVAGASFYFGTTYGKSQVPAQGQFTRTGMMGGSGQFTGMRGARGGITAGQILSKDATSITIKDQSGSSRIVLIGSDVTVMKTVAGTMNDLVVGENVSVVGPSNTDGSVTATSVQIRPASTKASQTGTTTSSVQ